MVAALSKVGYKRDRQKGSYIVLRQAPHPHRRIVIPDHREVAKGTLRAIIKQAALTVEQFNEPLLDRLFHSAVGVIRMPCGPSTNCIGPILAIHFRRRFSNYLNNNVESAIPAVTFIFPL